MQGKEKETGVRMLTIFMLLAPDAEIFYHATAFSMSFLNLLPRLRHTLSSSSFFFGKRQPRQHATNYKFFFLFPT